jgi:oligopeptide transport system substrate-binding protein
VPGSAESWQISEDRRTYTFRLREGLKWSDGRALTADDFVYSYRRLVTPETRALGAGVYFFIENAADIYAGKASPETLGVSAPDPRTVRFRLKYPVPYLLALLSNTQNSPVPRHVIEKHGNEWTRPGRMVTNGPYMLAERVPQNYLRLVKNPHFFDADRVKIDEVYWHPTQDLGTSLRRFRAGELDIVLNFPPEEIDWIRKNIPETLHVVPSLATYFLVFNLDRPPFDDARVRTALSLAIDREAITERLLRTGVRPAWTFASPEFDNYGGITLPEQSMPLAERQAEARRLLAAAGFGPGKPLKVPLVYDTQEENRKIMVAVASMWQAIGVQTAMTNVEFGALNRKVRTRDFDVARWAFFYAFNDAYSFLQALGSGNPNNWPAYSNREYDALLERSNTITDPAERAAVLRKAESVMMADHPIVPIYFYVGRRLVSPRVKGWVDSPRGTAPTRYLWLEEST